MKSADLIAVLQRENPSGDMPVKITTDPLNENGVDIWGVYIQEYDDGYLSYEIVLSGGE
jgi:hypothetical protein